MEPDTRRDTGGERTQSRMGGECAEAEAAEVGAQVERVGPRQLGKRGPS